MRKSNSRILSKAIHVVFLLPALIQIGCVTANTTKLSSASYPPVPFDQVNIYLSEDRIPGPYIEIGLINASGNHGWTNEEQMYNKMREEAGKMGGNGVLLPTIDEPGAGAKIAGAVFGVGVNRRGQAVVVLVENENTGSIASLQERQREARAGLPPERTCSNTADAQEATLYRVIKDRTPVVNTTGPGSRTLTILDADEYVLRVASFNKYEKVCFNQDYGYVHQDNVAAGIE